MTQKFVYCQWVVLNGYGFYGEKLVEKAVSLAKQDGAHISMDLASFEVLSVLDLILWFHVSICYDLSAKMFPFIKV